MQLSVVALGFVLMAMLMDIGCTNLFTDADQTVMEQLMNDETPEEQSEKQKEKEEFVKIHHVLKTQVGDASIYISMLHSRSERIEHLHFESVPTPPPEIKV